MTPAIRLLALLSLSNNFAPALRHVNRAAMYGGPPLTQPGATATVTATELSTVTVGSSCEIVYVPTTVTVYTGYPSPSEASMVPGLPLSTYSSHGPWVNVTSTPKAPCTHGLPTSAALPNNFSSSLGWNHTVSTSRPTLTGTAGATIETADPIGTSSGRWTNSTQTSAAEQDSTSVITLTVTSSATVTVNATATPGFPSPTVPSAGTGRGYNTTGSATSYQPSLTYQTTVPASSTPLANGTATNSPNPMPTGTWTLPPGWSISTVSPSTSTTGTPYNSSALTSSRSILTTETNDALFTTPSSLTSTTSAWSNMTVTSTRGWNTTTAQASTPTPVHPSSTAAVGGGGDDDDEGGEYGGYSYPAPSSHPSTTSGGSTAATSSASRIESVDAITGAISTSTGTGTGTGTGSVLAVTTFATETRFGAGAPSSSAAAFPGGGGSGDGGY